MNGSHNLIIDQYGSDNSLVNQTDSLPVGDDALPWMSHHQLVRPSDLPQTFGPLVYEGYVPEAFPPNFDFANLGPTNYANNVSNAAVPSRGLHENQFLATPRNEPDTLEQDQGEDQATVGTIPGEESEVPRKTKTARRKNPAKPRRPKGSGKRGGWSKGMKLGPRTTVQPSEEFNQLHQQAMDAFIDRHDPQRAMPLVLEAIEINPEIFSAHALLSEIYLALGDQQRAVSVIWMGAHTCYRDPSVWHQVIDTCLHRTTYSRQLAWEQVSYAFKKLSQLDPDNDEPRYQFAASLHKVGRHQPAITQLKRILDKMPHNSSCLKLYGECVVALGKVQEGIEKYEDAIAYYKENGSSEGDAFEWTDVNIYVDLLAQQKGDPVDNIAQAIKRLKKLSRWLLGRDVEAFWDNITEDDREWDAEDEPRRTAIDDFETNRFDEDSYGLGLPLEIRAQLGILRLRLGGCREDALAHFEWLEPEESGEDSNAHQFPDVFLKVANSLNDAGEHQEALRFYEVLQEVDELKDISFYLGLGTSSYICGRTQQAWKSFEAAHEGNPSSIEAKTYLSKLHADQGEKSKAIEYAEDAVEIAKSILKASSGRRTYERKEQRLVREAAQVALTQANQIPGPGSSQPRKRQRAEEIESDFEGIQESPRKRNRGPLKPVESTVAVSQERVRKLYDTLEHNTDAMRSGDATAKNVWMECAKDLVDILTGSKGFSSNEANDRLLSHGSTPRRFLQHSPASTPLDIPSPSPLHADSPGLGTGIPQSINQTDFFGIDYSQWLDIFLEYAVLLAHHPTLAHATRREPCYKIIADALRCAVWRNDQSSLLRIYTAKLAICLTLKDDRTLFNNVLRWFIKEYAFCTDPYRLFGAINLFYRWPKQKIGREATIPRTASESHSAERFLFPYLTSLDYHLPLTYTDKAGEPVPDYMRQTRAETMSLPTHTLPHNDQVVIRPQEMDVVLLMLYGQILYAAGSFLAALQHFFRARALDPDNPLVLFSIALCYMHVVQSKSADKPGINRNMHILQGWATFGEYEDKRLKWAKQKDEEDGVMNADGETMRMAKREVEYNRARLWLLLGMEDLAVTTLHELLEREWEQKEGVDRMNLDERAAEKGDVDWEKETAYALINVYASNGDGITARRIAEKCLVVE